MKRMTCSLALGVAIAPSIAPFGEHFPEARYASQRLLPSNNFGCHNLSRELLAPQYKEVAMAGCDRCQAVPLWLAHPAPFALAALGEMQELPSALPGQNREGAENPLQSCPSGQGVDYSSYGRTCLADSELCLLLPGTSTLDHTALVFRSPLLLWGYQVQAANLEVVSLCVALYQCCNCTPECMQGTSRSPYK